MGLGPGHGHLASAASGLPGLRCRLLVLTGTLAVTGLLATSAAGGQPGADKAGGFAGFPLIKGSPAEPGAPPGAWLESRIHLDHLAAGPRAAWKTTLDGVAAAIRESPALADLGGFYPRLVSGVDSKGGGLDVGTLSVQVWPLESIDAPTLSVKQDWRDYGPGGFSLYFNRFPAGGSGATEGLRRPGWQAPGSGDFFRLPPAEREIAGFPVLAGYLFVTAPGKPPLFLPVSREEALKAAIAGAEAQSEIAGEGSEMARELLENFNSPEMRELRRMAIEEAAAAESDPKRAAEARARAERDDREQERQLLAMAGVSPDQAPLTLAAREAAAMLRAELDRLDAAQRAAPAFIRTAPDSFLGDEIVGSEAGGAVPLMRFNPAFFDKSQPAALQLVWMSIGSRIDWENSKISPMQANLAERIAMAIVEQTDWRRVAALMR